VIGDVTIITDRLQYADFTLPYAESGLAMIVPAKPEGSPLTFTKPFTWSMWAVTGALLLYTMIIVWLLERQSNPEFGHGTWKNQISTALWFTFSSLFFAHSKYQYTENSLSFVSLKTTFYFSKFETLLYL
jgi:hypothetical protein